MPLNGKKPFPPFFPRNSRGHKIVRNGKREKQNQREVRLRPLLCTTQASLSSFSASPSPFPVVLFSRPRILTQESNPGVSLHPSAGESPYTTRLRREKTRPGNRSRFCSPADTRVYSLISRLPRSDTKAEAMRAHRPPPHSPARIAAYVPTEGADPSSPNSPRANGTPV